MRRISIICFSENFLLLLLFKPLYHKVLFFVKLASFNNCWQHANYSTLDPQLLPPLSFQLRYESTFRFDFVKCLLPFLTAIYSNLRSISFVSFQPS